MVDFHTKRGGAAMEYIVVSLFGLVVTMAALTYLGRTFEKSLVSWAERLGVEAPEFDFDFLGRGGG